MSRKRIFSLGAVGFVLVLVLIGRSAEPPERPEVPLQADSSSDEAAATSMRTRFTVRDETKNREKQRVRPNW